MNIPGLLRRRLLIPDRGTRHTAGSHRDERFTP
jgi:hypothetical protein